MKNIFVYGTLMLDEVWQKLSLPHYDKINAELTDFIRLKVKEKQYPGITPSRGNRVEGKLVLNINSNDIAKLDNFEGKYYIREKVKVISNGTEFFAETYLFRKRYRSLLSNDEWDIEKFRVNGLTSFLSMYDYFK